MNRVSLMLVDNNPNFVRALSLFLDQNYAAEVVLLSAANDCKEALAQAKLLRPQVVLVELCLPDLEALEFISQLRTILPHVGVVALTLLDITGYRQAALAAGADEFVSKATVDTDLLPLIRKLMSRAQHLIPATSIV